MYQYAFGLQLAQKYNATLSLDTWSGFLFDPYQRSFQLKPFFPNCKQESLFSVLISVLMSKLSTFSRQLAFRFSSNSKQLSPWFVFSLGTRKLLTELRPFSEDLKLNKRFSSLRYRGYYQSQELFKDQMVVILNAIRSYKPHSQSVLNLGTKLHIKETVAVGIRLYEETLDPEANAHNSKIKSLDALNHVLSQFLKAHSGCQVAIFCTHRSPLFNQLNLPNNTVFLTGDDDILSAHHTVWLISQCKHHIFLNSSLYWWGAYLSRINHDPSGQEIYAADNFINQACYLNDWHRF